jgi:hypothetical protein
VPTTDWAVEAVLDTRGFSEWLEGTAVLDSVTFTVKLPNHDAEDAFEQIFSHMRSQGAGKLVETLTPEDPDIGLNKDLEADSWGHGLMEMARRTFAQLRARGRAPSGRKRTYNQSEKVRRRRVRMGDSHAGALAALIQFALGTNLEETDNE